MRGTPGVGGGVPDPIFKQLAIIEKKFGDFPLSALSDPGTRGIFKAWRDELAINSVRQRDVRSILDQHYLLRDPAWRVMIS